MLSLLVIILGTLHYGYCGNWSVHYRERIQRVTSGCTTIQCSYTYPLEHQVKAEIWTGSPLGLSDKKEVIAYHTNEDLIDPFFKGRTTFLGNKNGDCALHINDVTMEDRGVYRFKMETNIRVFSAEDNVFLVIDLWDFHIHRMYDPDESCSLYITPSTVFQEGKEGVLTCDGTDCKEAPQWYNSDGEKITEGTSSEDLHLSSLSITPSWQDNGKVIQCRGYRFDDMCMITAKSTLHVRHTPKGIQTVLLSSFTDQSHGGDTTLLKCVVIASNPAVSNYTWYKDGSQIPNQSMQIIRIENMKITELGRFSCVAHNEVGPSLPSPSNLVSFTEGVPRTSQSCSSFPSDLLIGISVAAVVAIIISVALSTWCYLKNKKKSNPAKVTELALKSSQHESGNRFYSNMENAYAALDKTEISSDYEEIKRQEDQHERANTNGQLHAS